MRKRRAFAPGTSLHPSKIYRYLRFALDDRLWRLVQGLGDIGADLQQALVRDLLQNLAVAAIALGEDESLRILVEFELVLDLALDLAQHLVREALRQFRIGARARSSAVLGRMFGEGRHAFI